MKEIEALPPVSGNRVSWSTELELPATSLRSVEQERTME